MYREYVRFLQRMFCVLCCMVGLTACATGMNPRDPYESTNRMVYQFNRKVDAAVMKPAAQVYQAVTPSPLRRGISNVLNNFRDVVSFANHVVQLKPEAALNDFFRVTVNTVFGLGGVLNVADSMGLKNQKAGFGDTLARYGWKNSSYVMLPFLGPSTVRDAVGAGVDFYAQPMNFIWSGDVAARNTITGVSVLEKREALLGTDTLLDEAALDSYVMMRETYLQVRDHQVGNQTEDVSVDELLDEDRTPPTDIP